MACKPASFRRRDHSRSPRPWEVARKWHQLRRNSREAWKFKFPSSSVPGPSAILWTWGFYEPNFSKSSSNGILKHVFFLSPINDRSFFQSLLRFALMNGWMVHVIQVCNYGQRETGSQSRPTSLLEGIFGEKSWFIACFRWFFWVSIKFFWVHEKFHWPYIKNLCKSCKKFQKYFFSKTNENLLRCHLGQASN